MNAATEFPQLDPDFAEAPTAAPAHRPGRQLYLSFTVASVLLLAGVSGSWVFVKRAGGSDDLAAANLAMDALPVSLYGTGDDGIATLLEQADRAFAAGRFVEPRLDNALYFYRAALEQAPGDSAASAGIDRVVQRLISQMETAVAAKDLDRAEAIAAHVVELRPGDTQASGRLRELTRVRELTAQASRQHANGAHGAAAASWKELLVIDASNGEAVAGVHSSVAALVEAGNKAVAERRSADAQARLNEARAILPNAPGVAALAAGIQAVAQAASVAARDNAIAVVRAAVEVGAVSTDNGVPLLDAIAALAAQWPDVVDGAELVAEARSVALAKAQAAAAADDFTATDSLIVRAAALGVDTAALNAVQDELAWRRYVAAFNRGEWTLRTSNDFTITQRAAPAYPARADRVGDAWVNVEFTVDTDGTVRDAVVAEASSRLFVPNSLNAIAQWRFEPYVVGGRPAPARAVVRFSFRS